VTECVRDDPPHYPHGRIVMVLPGAVMDGGMAALANGTDPAVAAGEAIPQRALRSGRA
jgi:hypothetical protein